MGLRYIYNIRRVVVLMGIILDVGIILNIKCRLYIKYKSEDNDVIKIDGFYNFIKLF